MSSTGKVRLFFGIPLPDKLALAAAQAGAALERAADRKLALRTIASPNVHVTLKFLGWLEAERIAELEQGLAEIACRFAAIRARASALDAFPKPSRARVLVIRLEAGDELTALANALEELAANVGVERERRPFKAHATIARLSQPGDVRRVLEASAWVPLECTLERVTLFQSTMLASGSVYTSLASQVLRS